MFYLLFTLVGLIFLIWAPLNVTIMTGSIIILIPTVVRFSTKLMTGHDISFGEAFKAVVLSLFLPIVGLLWLVSTLGGVGATIEFSGVGSLIFLVGLFAAYALGYKISLGLEFKPSMAIAGLSTLLSGVGLLVIRSFF
ncbi:hypothetical protein [Methylomonas methanica]|uniref:Uncharacterized protein n=1 Tax=Methylomonas methanica TaxID=421 RepID=A0A177MTC4_METMH|nr:hypothetical protein [Methylomonas methanica]OAI05341.1 hypothetical protein A1332_13395 [Methylomonas methanica]OAI08160.1 hypothetical protein A1353_05850 [Methylomonas methanica]